jgi:hypothetical protein
MFLVVASIPAQSLHMLGKTLWAQQQQQQRQQQQQ